MIAQDWFLAKFYFFVITYRTFLVHPTFNPLGFGGSFPSGKIARAWSSPYSSAKVKNMRSFTCTPISLHLCGITLRQGNLPLFWRMTVHRRNTEDTLYETCYCFVFVNIWCSFIAIKNQILVTLLPSSQYNFVFFPYFG